ncbi:hypothetical protein EYF80_054238 [Liparis tanakae]|uniref:Uncharacterized protein n=1 Tax=Liparis tanakae TaxID=230148 RepID=A0A4Z2F2Z5_9TELE|nr:hypothetical protein EYF80_054238 [Liparis tanakae]
MAAGAGQRRRVGDEYTSTSLRPGVVFVVEQVWSSSWSRCGLRRGAGVVFVVEQVWSSSWSSCGGFKAVGGVALEGPLQRVGQELGHAVVQLDGRPAQGHLEAIAHALGVQVAERRVGVLQNERKRIGDI